MKLLLIKDFAIKYGIKRENVYTYKNRGKLVLNEGFVDEENPINKIFIASRSRSNHVKVNGKIKEVDKIPERVEQKKVKRNGYENDPTVIKFNETADLKDENLKEDLRLKRLKNDKTEGKLIPTESVKQYVGEVVLRYKTSFLQSTEQLFREVLNEMLADNSRITNTCSRLTDIANEASKRTMSEVRITIDSIIEESSLK